MTLPLLKPGLHPDASDALRRLCVPADQIVQTIGYAAASAGTHAPDGEAAGQPYTCAVDFSVHHPVLLLDPAIRSFLGRLASAGFAGWYRCPGQDHWPAGAVAHIHAVYAGAPMKLTLRNQVHDWCHGRNGLASHAPYWYWQPAADQVNTVRTLFLAHNPVEG